MQAETILPWQKNIWELLSKLHRDNRLPHALLFSGADDYSQKLFALKFSNYLLCSSPQNNMACHHCRPCHLQHAKSHPDFMQISKEEAASFIKIDQIRDVVNFVNGTALFNGYRIVVIDSASTMNGYAANALLKTLEEPASNTLFILICNQNLRLPKTIISRCQKIIFKNPSREVALNWLNSESSVDAELKLLALNLTDGSPLAAQDFIINDIVTLRNNLFNGLIQLSTFSEDPLQFAAKWENQDIKIILNLLLIWLRDLLQFKVTASKKYLINMDYYQSITDLTRKLTSENLLKYYDNIQNFYAEMVNSLNINRSLLLKEIFIRWMKIC